MSLKPLKRNKHIIQLSKDHHVTLLFCWKIRTGLKLKADTSRMKNYLNYFWQHHMQPHFFEEETILFAPVTDTFVERALREHKEIAQKIMAINEQEANLTDSFSHLADMVDKHVRFEERELFPHLEQILTEQQLEAIGDNISKNHDANLTDDYADEFWINKN